MSFTHSVLVSAFLATLLTACKKAETPPAPTLSGASGSIAAPESAMPSPDAKIPVASPVSATGSGNASSSTQADPKELTKEQEATSMPLSGQANNHSTPAATEEKK
ncbi:MAG: hypothetical protein HHJ09_09030 [Glaciimonas sp.]|nr:hypothetical protein [Glaciimonas sp.]